MWSVTLSRTNEQTIIVSKSKRQANVSELVYGDVFAVMKKAQESVHPETCWIEQVHLDKVNALWWSLDAQQAAFTDRILTATVL